ncbi:MAG: adenosylcobalamin-dependent ribonucleoside-diphosphate reductase [Bacteroidetes bacterium]|nr:MAG: adenosylcobalamin-dependent ribonucleoside-diphosphate reductase [Bacteroidota bacterium]
MSEKFNWMQSISGEIFKKKYMINGEETEDEVFRGVAKEIARVEPTEQLKEKWENKFYEAISTTKLIPAGRILANARPDARMPFYNNCYTISVEDSIESIYNSLREDALISRTGGGVGLNFSKLRPKDAGLSTGGVSSGVISFMKVFNESAKVIQTGGSRRAAHIGILNVDHPEIEDFILAKRGDENKALTQFNISVGITDKFMNAVKADADWDLIWEGTVYKTIKAKYLYKLMTMNAFTHNEPGILNLDTVNRMNNGAYGFQIFEVNPCGEIVMPPYSLCCLSALNLTQFVVNAFTSDAFFDIDEFKKYVEVGIRFLDNVLDATEYPLDKILDMSKQWRRIGLGFTGLGNVFSMLRMSYGSEESKVLSELIGKVLRNKSYKTSALLAEEKGAFPACINEELIKSPFIKELPKKLQAIIKTHGLRNIAMNTVAPTGTTSLSIGQNCSSGIEPAFNLSYVRNIRTGKSDETKSETVYDYAWLKYLEYLEKNGFEFTGDAPEFFKTTFNIDVYDAMDIQIIFQKYIDHSISKTLNLPYGTTYEEYKNLFEHAYDNGLKGFTTFNPEGSMKGILEIDKKIEVERTTPKRPKDLPCDVHELTYKGDKYILLVGKYNNTPYEIFVTKNVDKEFDFDKNKSGIIRKSGRGKYSLIVENGKDKTYIEDIVSSFDSVYGTLGRFISMSIRHNVSLQFIVEQLNKDKNFMGFERTVSRVLKKYIKEGEEVKTSHDCPECGNDNLIYQEGCLACPDCGWSKCS